MKSLKPRIEYLAALREGEAPPTAPARLAEAVVCPLCRMRFACGAVGYACPREVCPLFARVTS